MDFKRNDIGQYLVWPINKKDIDPFFNETVNIIGLPNPDRLTYKESISKNYELESIKFDYSGTRFNTKYSDIWPNISERKDPPSDHEKYKNEQNKFEKYFKENL
mgnify:CR=1 FL=1